MLRDGVTARDWCYLQTEGRQQGQGPQTLGGQGDDSSSPAVPWIGIAENCCCPPFRRRGEPMPCPLRFQKVLPQAPSCLLLELTSFHSHRLFFHWVSTLSCFRKQILHKKYGFPLSMTEKEMITKLNYHRIWDCGLYKYVWRLKE